jgi:peroxiredoxin
MRYATLALLICAGCTTTTDDNDGDTDGVDTEAQDDADTNDADTDDADDADTDDADTDDADTGAAQDCALTAGRCAPEFVLPDETDADFALSDLEGSRVLVMGNAMWCPPCNNLAEDVNEWAASAQAPSDLEVVIVVVEDNNFSQPDAADIARFKQGLGLTVNTVADEDGTWIENWGNTRYSYTTIDANGTVNWHTTGYQSLSTLTDQIQAIPQ